MSDRGWMSAGKRQADSQADEGGAPGIPAAQPGQWQAHQSGAAQILFQSGECHSASCLCACMHFLIPPLLDVCEGSCTIIEEDIRTSVANHRISALPITLTNPSPISA